MFKHPIRNALAASLYIVLIVSVLTFISNLKSEMPDNNFLAPLFMISLLTLSAAVMGYLFLSQPLQLYLDGHKKEAVTFFGYTVGVFSVIVAILLGCVLLF